jgi:ribosomal protein S18 acetylase RimI-like enzyme
VDGVDLTVRRATRDDMPALGRLGAMLMRTHYAFDPLRFLSPGDAPEEGYGWFLGSQLAEDDVVVLVAEQRGEIVGYVYAGIEPLSWKELRDEAGFIHDIAVDERARRAGVAGQLLDAAIAWVRGRGVARVVLWTAEPNAAAQQLFAAHGFRRTMVEMTREL